MKENLTELVFILDKSGSMCGLEADTIGGFNSLIEKQKKETGEAVVSTVLFSDDSKVLHNRVNLQEVGKMTDKEYFTSGCTALLDAVGSAIKHIVKVQDSLSDEEKPAKTLFVITTDGQENVSHEYTYANIKKLIEKQRELGWEFIFLGANIDAAEEAAKVGILKENAVNYNCDEVGVELNYKSLNMAIGSARRNKKIDSSWRAEIDEDYKKRNKK